MVKDIGLSASCSSASGLRLGARLRASVSSLFLPGIQKGVGDLNRGRIMQLLNAPRSTHNLMPLSFFGTSTIGCSYAVGSVTFLMILGPRATTIPL